MRRRRLPSQAPRWALAVFLMLALAGNVCGVPWTSQAEIPRHHHDGAAAAGDGHHDAPLLSCEAHAVQLPDRADSLAAAGPAIVLATPVLTGGRRRPGAPAVIAPGPPLFLLHASLLI